MVLIKYIIRTPPPPQKKKKAILTIEAPIWGLVFTLRVYLEVQGTY